jgi:hypothetical protein
MQNGSKLGHSKPQENGLEKSIWKMGNKVANCEVTPQAIWPVAKSLTKTSGTKASSEIHGPLGPIFFANR